MTAPRPGRGIVIAVYLLLAIASGFADLRFRTHVEHPVKVYMPQVVDGSAEAPGLYRVLAPFSFEFLARATQADRMTLWHLTRLAWFLVAWLIWHAYLSTWFDEGTAMLGTALVAALLPMTFTNSWAHPDHLPELALFTAGCLAIARNHDGWFLAVLVLAALNRETSAFLLPVYALAGRLDRARVIKTVGFGAAWVAIFVGLRWLRGFKMYDYWQLARNLEFLKLLPPNYDPYYRAYGWFSVILFVPLFYVALSSRRLQPLFMRRAYLCTAPVFLAAWTISSVIETRIFTPVFPLIVPGVVFTLSRSRVGTTA